MCVWAGHGLLGQAAHRVVFKGVAGLITWGILKRVITLRWFQMSQHLGF